MKKVWAIVLSFVMLCLCVSCDNGNDDNDLHDLNSVFDYGYGFGKAPSSAYVKKYRTVAIDESKIANALIENASPDDVVNAIEYLFNTAETNKLSAEYWHVRSASDGEATTTFGSFTVGGYMDIRSFIVYNDGEWYDQITGVVVRGIPEQFLNAGKMLLNYSTRKYHPKNGLYYKEKSKGLKADADFLPNGLPTGNFELKDTLRQTFDNDQTYMQYNDVNNNVNETLSVDITAESIDQDRTLSLTHDEGYYTLTFSIKLPANSFEEAQDLDVTSEEYEELSQYAKFKRDFLRGATNSENLEVIKLDYVIEIWDEGYFKTSKSYESWYATLKIVKKILEPTGASDNCDSKTFSYDKRDCEIADYVGGNWYETHKFELVA